MRADYAEVIAHHQVWVAEAAQQMIGGRVLIPEEDALLLDTIAVHPEYQGLGIGRALLERADAEVLCEGYGALRLYTHETMTENMALYTRNGWVETYRGHHAGSARVFMRKRLSPPA